METIKGILFWLLVIIGSWALLIAVVFIALQLVSLILGGYYRIMINHGGA